MRIHLRRIWLVMAMFISLKSVSQQLIQGTLKQGPNPDEVQVWIKPNFSNTTEYLYQIGIPIAWPSTASPQPTITLGNITVSDQFKTVFGTNYSPTVNPAAPSTCGTEFYTNIVLVRGGGGASNSQTWIAGTEYLVCTVKFTPSGSPGAPVRLVDYPDGGSDGQGNFYTVDGNAHYYVSSMSVNNFYSATGQSTAGSGLCGSGGAQTNIAIPVSCIAPAINVSNITTTTADIGWDLISSASGYEYFISTSSSVPTSGTPNAGMSFQATSLSPGNKYYIFVRTNCGAGGFSSWATTNFTTPSAPCNSPTGLTIGTVGITTAEINWGTVAGASGYEYVLSTSSGTPVSAGTAILGTTFNASGLFGSTQYYIYVRTNCGSGNYSPWVSATFTTLAPSCVATSAPTIEQITATSAIINWNAINGSSGYEYVITTDTGIPSGVGTAISGTSYAATSLTVGTTYHVFIRNNCGGGLYSAWTSTTFTTSCPTPASVSVPVATITSTSAIITWNSTGPTSYQYDISTSSSPPTDAPSPATTTTGTSYMAAGLTAGIMYYAHIRSICGAGYFSEWVTVPFTTICSEPGPILVNSIKPTSANISWGEVSDVNGYEYVVSTNNNIPSSGTAILFNSILPSDLVPGTQYFVYVRTECSPGIYSTWITKSFITPYPPCNIPTNLNVNNLGTTAEISWSIVTEALGYEIAVTTNSTEPTSGQLTGNKNFSVQDLISNTQYYVYVRSRCKNNQVSTWAKLQFKTQCFKPFLFLVNNSTTLGTAELGWHSIKGALEYEYSILESGASPNGSLNFTTDTILKVQDLRPGNKYFLHVRTHCTPTGISDWGIFEFYTSGLAILTNSSGNLINIIAYGQQNHNNEVAVFDGVGKLVKRIGVTGNTSSIDMSGYPSGVYFVRWGNSKFYIKRFIKL